MEQLKSLSPQEVELFLLNNPSFFNGRDRLIKQMQLTHASGKAVSLLERQNEVLRKQNAGLEQRLDDLIGNAHRNDRMFQHLQAMVLSAIVSQDIDTLTDILRTQLCSYFNVDAFNLFVSDPAEGWETQFSLVDRLLNKKSAYCGSLNKEGLHLLFNAELDKGSVAIARKEFDGCKVVICLASQDETYYRNSMDTLFLNYLADVTCRMASRISR